MVDPIAGKVVEHHARLVTTYGDEVRPDSVWIERVRHWDAATGPVAATPVGSAVRRVPRGSPESPIGDLVADAMRAATRTDVAFQNTGGLRAELPEGLLTKGSIYEVMPFDNTMTMVTLTGAEVRQVIEEGLTYGRVTQVSGIRFTYDPDGPDGQRVMSIVLADGSPLVETRDYRAVCNNFMATGGDNYSTLGRGRDKRDEGALVRDALERYVTEKSANGGALDVTADGRIQRARHAVDQAARAAGRRGAGHRRAAAGGRADTRRAGALEVGAHPLRDLARHLLLERGVLQQARLDRVVDERGLDQHRRELHRLEHGETRLLDAPRLEPPVDRDVVEQRLGHQLALLQRRGALHVVEDRHQIVLGVLGTPPTMSAAFSRSARSASAWAVAPRSDRKYTSVPLPEPRRRDELAWMLMNRSAFTFSAMW